MPWTRLNFGKHRGKTLPQIVLSDPDWFFWAWENDGFKAHYEREASEIFEKATHIRVPQTGTEELCAEYWIGNDDKKFHSFKLVPKSRGRHEGGSRTERLHVIDLSFPRRCKRYDKTGGLLIIKNLKKWVFQNPRLRFTRKTCEDFFDNPDNFDLRSG